MGYQLVTCPTALQVLDQECGKDKNYLLELFTTFTSTFNLTFGRIYYTFCLNPTASTFEFNLSME